MLFDRAGEANVVLTRRSRHLSVHRGEVAFPGGRLLTGEAPLHAALREANEEVGVAPGSVRVLGELTPLTTLRSQAVVYCFVGGIPEPGPTSATFVANLAEVERVFWVPLALLAEDGVYHEELWPAGVAEAGPAYRAVPFFELGHDTVWGATGRLLNELLSVVLQVRACAQAQGRYPDEE